MRYCNAPVNMMNLYYTLYLGYHTYKKKYEMQLLFIVKTSIKGDNLTNIFLSIIEVA